MSKGKGPGLRLLKIAYLWPIIPAEGVRPLMMSEIENVNFIEYGRFHCVINNVILSLRCLRASESKAGDQEREREREKKKKKKKKKKRRRRRRRQRLRETEKI